MLLRFSVIEGIFLFILAISIKSRNDQPSKKMIVSEEKNTLGAEHSSNIPRHPGHDITLMMCIAKLLALATLGKVLAKLVLTTFCNVY